MLFNEILVVLNPETDKQYALERAVRLIKEQKNTAKVKITAFMAVYDLSYEMSVMLSAEEGERMRNGVIKQRTKQVQPIIEKYVSDLSDIEVNTVVVWNNNEADAITEIVKLEKFDLVVKYANEEAEGLSSIIFAPQDWQLLRKCHAPIMMVRNGDWQNQRRVLVAVNVGENDDSHLSFNRELVTFGMDIANDLERGNVHLVSAYPPTAVDISIELPEFNTPTTRSVERDDHIANMESLRKEFNIDADHTHVEEGFPEDVIPQVAQQLDAEIVVLGTVGRSGLSAAFVGNTAEHVINKLTCNLLAIKPSQPLK